MYLTMEEQEMLDGKHGYPVQKAMELLVGIGDCYDAKRMIPISSAHILYNSLSLGRGGSLFMQEMAEKGAKFVVHTDTNPSCLMRSGWREFGFSEEYAENQTVIANAIMQMGGFCADTCAPYMVGHVPRMGEHVAWNESSAIVFANSVLGARTNREGGPSAVAAALTGRTPEFGYHLDENRKGQLIIQVTTELTSQHDYSTLGYFVGKLAGDRVPVIKGIPQSVSWDELKSLGASMCTSGSVTLYHVVGVTPEAMTEEAAFGGIIPDDIPAYEFSRQNLQNAEADLSKATGSKVDTIILGCPHASIIEMGQYADLLCNKKVSPDVDFWITTSHMVKAYSDSMGFSEIIEKSGAKILCAVCPASLVGIYAVDGRSRKFATNSAKIPYYTGQYLAEGQRLLPFYGSTEKCVSAGLTGLWR